MNNLSGEEEAMLTGLSFASLSLTGPVVDGSGNPVPFPGNTVGITFSGGNLVGSHLVTTTAVTGDSLLTLAARISSQVNQDTTMQAGGILSLAPYGTGPFALSTFGPPGGNPSGNLSVPLPVVSFISPIAFTVTSVTSTGLIGPALTNPGGFIGPVAPVDYTVNPFGLVYGYVPIANKLEGSYLGSTQNLDLAQAGGPEGVTYRMTERKERHRLYTDWCRDMAVYFFGLESEDGLVGSRTMGAMRAVV